jgi:spore coat protein U-like protein
MRIARHTALAVSAAATLFAGHAAAQSSPQTANLAVSASVAANCAVSTTPLDFGNYNPLSAATVTGTGTIQLRCTRGTTPAIALNAGVNAAGSQRRMTAGGEYLAYNLVRPTSNTPGAACPGVGSGTAWDSTPWTLTSAANSSLRTYNVCGELPGSQDVSAGTYTDTVVATVTF